MPGTNVTTAPQYTTNGENERRHGGRSTKVKARFKGKYNSKGEDANA
jgi:hypothetical protein